MKNRQPALLLIGLGLIILSVAAGLAVYSQLGTDEPQSATQQNEQTSCAPPAQVSFPAPDLEMTNVNGEIVRLNELDGQVVVLNTWATWCPPCRAEMPDLEAFYRRHQDQGMTLVGINIGETMEQVQAFIQAYQLTFQVWLDPNESSLRAFNTISLPSTFVIDRSGQVRFIWSGMTCIDQLESNVTPLILDL